MKVHAQQVARRESRPLENEGRREDVGALVAMYHLRFEFIRHRSQDSALPHGIQQRHMLASTTRPSVCCEQEGETWQ